MIIRTRLFVTSRVSPNVARYNVAPILFIYAEHGRRISRNTRYANRDMIVPTHTALIVSKPGT